jgi:hypothetical protein
MPGSEEDEMKYDSLRGTLIARLPLLVTILCVIQPILDVMGYWQQLLGLPNAVTFLLRVLLLGASLLLGFLLSERKSRYLILGGVLAALTALHAFACLRSPFGYRDPVKDLSNLVMIYSLPIMTFSFVTFFRANERVLPAAQKALTAVLLIIFSVQLISTLTGTDPHTYSMHDLGVLGWFNWTNSQSAILSMLYPVALCFVLRRWPDRILPLAITAAVGGAALFVLGPRLAYASLFVVGFGFAVFLLICDRAKWKQALALTLVVCLFIALYPISPVRRRAVIYDERNEETQAEIDEILSSGPQDEGGSEPSPEQMETLYRSRDLLCSMIERFGRDRVLEAYDDSTDPDVLRDDRRAKLTFCRLLMEDSSPLSRLFGLNLTEMTVWRNDGEGELVSDVFDVENDFHGIYFLTGTVGLALCLLMLLGVCLRALAALLRRPKLCFTPLMGANAIAYGLALIHCYFTACILRRPNASIYLAVVLATLWVLSDKAWKKGEEQDALREEAAP